MIKRGMILFALLAACGGTGGSVFDGSEDAPNGTGSGSGSGNFGDGFNNDPQGTTAACVSSLAQAQLTPVNLVIMYDKSGSMGAVAEGFDPNKKWIPIGAGMKAFLADPGSKGLNASLQFFPLGGSVEETCNYAYATPRVGVSPLTDPSAFVSAIDQTTPFGGTPTYPALNGALTYARTVAKSRPGEKTAVVLATDGEPGYRIDGQNVPGCANNTIDKVAELAKSGVAEGISTYVIGVGANLANLNTIASAGGTGKAMMISVVDPTATRAEFQKALESVRASTLSCAFGIPAAPSGETINYRAVNVVLTSADGKENVLSYSGDCSNGAGWHYDNLEAPTRIELCSASCSTAQADRQAKISIAFGCMTKGIVK
jgi:hypothetical protein